MIVQTTAIRHSIFFSSFSVFIQSRISKSILICSFCSFLLSIFSILLFSILLSILCSVFFPLFIRFIFWSSLLFSFQICYPFFSLSYYSVLSASPLCSIPIKSVLFLLVLSSSFGTEQWWKAPKHHAVCTNAYVQPRVVNNYQTRGRFRGGGVLPIFCNHMQACNEKWKRSNNIVPVHKSIFEYLQENCLLCDNQSGFRPFDFHVSINYTFYVVHDIYASFDCNRPKDVRDISWYI